MNLPEKGRRTEHNATDEAPGGLTVLAGHGCAEPAAEGQ